MNIILKVVIFVVILFLILAGFHFYKFNDTRDIFSIIQKNIDSLNGEILYYNKEPLVIDFIEDQTLEYNIKKYNLKTPLTIEENYTNMTLDSNTYIGHNYEICLMRPKKDITLTLVNPGAKKYFSFKKRGDGFSYFNLDKKNYSNVKSVDILVYRHTIFCLPRNWLVSIEKPSDLEIYTTQNIFTKLFTFFI